MTPEWKAKVRAALDLNAEAGRVPANPKDLARLLGADPAGIYRMLRPGQLGSKYVRPVCKLLGLDEPTSATVDDEWTGLVNELRAASPEDQEHALAVLRTFVKRLDSGR